MWRFFRFVLRANHVSIKQQKATEEEYVWQQLSFLLMGCSLVVELILVVLIALCHRGGDGVAGCLV